MKSFGKIFLCVGLLGFFIVGHASGKTYYVTQGGDGGTLSATQFNNLRGDYSGDTFYFIGDFNIRINVMIHGSESGHVTLDGLQNATCKPTTAVDHSLCSVGGVQAANLQYGMALGTRRTGVNYVIIQDFNMNGQGTSSHIDYFLEINCGGGGHNVVRRNTVSNTPSSFMDLSGTGTHSPNNVVEDNKFYGFHKHYWAETSMRIQRIRNSLIRRNIYGGDGVHSPPPWKYAGEFFAFHACRQILVEYNQIFRSHGQSLIRPKEGGHQEHIVVRYNNLWGAAWHGISSYGNTQYNHYFYGNRIANIDTLAVNIMSDCNDQHVWANLIYDGGQRGADFRPQLTYGNPNGIHFSNNTVVHNGFDPYLDRHGIQANEVDNYMRMFNNIVMYNDTSVTHPKNVVSGTGAHHISGHNIVYSGDRTRLWKTNSGSDADKTLSDMQALGKETNTLVADPLLANIGSVPAQKRFNAYKDLRLTAGSPAINSGLDLASYGSFSVNLSGGNSWFQNYTGYGTITFSYDDGLHPDTDWTTPIPSVFPAKYSEYGSGWERGAYVFDEGSMSETNDSEKFKTTTLYGPKNFRLQN